jgi:hypothetical protein
MIKILNIIVLLLDYIRDGLYNISNIIENKKEDILKKIIIISFKKENIGKYFVHIEDDNTSVATKSFYKTEKISSVEKRERERLIINSEGINFRFILSRGGSEIIEKNVWYKTELVNDFSFIYDIYDYIPNGDIEISKEEFEKEFENYKNAPDLLSQLPTFSNVGLYL